MPRPTRRLACLAPAPGLMVLSSMFLPQLLGSEHLHQVRDLVDHAAHRGRVFQLAFAVELAQAQAAHRGAVRFLGAGDALDQLDLDGFLVAHWVLQGQPRISSTVKPRLAAISAGVLVDFSAFSVARTRLYGLVEPRLLATMSVTPITSKTARIGPPAMMPSPCLAGAISTRDAPCSPTTLCWIVPFLSWTLIMLRRAESIALVTATGTSLALPLPMPMRPSPSPTTVSAAKLSVRPPFTTLVTRLTAIIFSFRPSSLPSVCWRG